MSEASCSFNDEEENTTGLKNAGHGDASANSETVPDEKTSGMVSTENTFEVLQCQVFHSFDLLHRGPSTSADNLKQEVSIVSETPMHKDGGDADMQKGILVTKAEEENSKKANVENIGVTLSPHQKNYVVDYKDFRRKGYFLDAKSSRPQKASTELSSLEVVASKNFVLEWLSGFPENVGDSENDTVDELEAHDITRYDMLSRFMTDEDHFKRLILKSGNTLQYSGNLEPALTSEQLEDMLGRLNKQINEHLSKLTNVPQEHCEYEYVSGTVGIPINWEINEAVQTKSYFSSLITCISRLLFKGKISDESQNNDGAPQADVHEVVLKPYHGPVILHGATIDAGSTNVVRSDVYGKLVEEVKAVLGVIHNALRKETPVPAIPISESEQAHPPPEDDPEIQRLTEMLLQARSRTKSKSTLRTVFGFRKAPNVRTLTNDTRHRRPNEQRKSRLIRAVGGWVHRKRRGGQGSDNLRNIGRNRVNPAMDQNQQQNVPLAGNFFTAFLASILNLIRSCVSRLVSFYTNNNPNPANAPEVQNSSNNLGGPSLRTYYKQRRNSVHYYGSHQSWRSRRRLWM